MKHFVLVTVTLAFYSLLSAQSTTNPWIFKSESQLSTKNQLHRHIIPENYKTAHLDLGSLKSRLLQAPMWQMEGSEKKAVSLALPMPDGSFQEFSIVEAPILHPDLQKKYPLIRSYAGTGVDDPTAYLRFDLTPAGFHAMILTGMSSDIFIDPYSEGDLENYVVYYKKDFVKTGDWKCWVEESSKEPVDLAMPKAGDCKLRTYSLALACTGEYATYHGGTKNSALAAMNTTMTRVNGIFEKELSVTLQLVANNDLLVYTNASTDPYTNNSGSTMLSQNISNCNAVIGSANYDIGHVFSTGGGGIAYVKSVCSSSVKGGGVTGNSAPVGDPYDIDYVAHEMGHQLGANHVQNNPCNRNDATAVEPGSGSTIMSYAGVCSPNIQSHSDAYFNAISLGEIAAHVTSTAGNGCATSSIINNVPAANAGADYVIPKSTYFVLTGAGTDPDAGQTLTYCWEQMDNAASTMPPVATNTGGPAFRSFAPSSSPSRYFPNLTAIVNNTTPTWEVLPAVGRTLNFRFTVRDNKVGGGCTKEDNMVVTVNGNAGPFVLTAPNTAVSWAGGSTQTVTWNIAGTTAAPVSCANVDILLSTDGGFTYPTTLLSGTPNDGSQSVTIPNTPSTSARIMVRGSENIFFDISNVNFIITSGTNPALAVSISSTNVNCNGTSTGSAIANPAGGSGAYTYAWSNGATTQTINNLSAGTYTVTVTSNGTTSTASTNITQPATLSISMTSVHPTSGNNGYATATPSGGTSPFTYAWSNGSVSQTIGSLAAGTYTVTVTDAKGCTKTGSVTLTSTGGSIIKFEHGKLTNVTNTWQTVTLQNSYSSMVVVANAVMANSTEATCVTRIQNAAGNSFQVKLQVAGNATGVAGPATVYFIVAEEGTYTTAANGVKFEAKKFTSTKTSRSTSWVYEPRTYSQAYTSPVVIGQVMTYNDQNWSVAWTSQNGSKANPPTASSLSIGKHIGEDNMSTTRANETIGYFVFEAGAGFINGKKYRTANGSDTVKGPSNSTSGYSYTLSGMTTVEAAVLGACAMDGTEGYVPAFATASPLTATTLKTWAVEDQISDSERSHTTDQIAFFAIGTGSPIVPGELPQRRQESQNEQPVSNFLIAYPNPARNEVTVEFQQNLPDGPLLLLNDSYGKLRQRQVLIPAEPGLRQAKLDLSKLEAGIYYLQIFEGNHRRTVKVVRMLE